jgi:uncharacterized protein (TIGR02466 family)
MSISSLRWNSGTAPKNHQAKSFLPLLRAAIAVQPERLDLLRDLAVALRDNKCWTEIIELLAPLRLSGRLAPELGFELGYAALAVSDPNLALAALDLAVAGGFGPAFLQRACALDALGQAGEARVAARRALEEDPHDIGALDWVAMDLLGQGEARALRTLCRDLEARGVWSTTLLAFMTAGTALAGDRDALAALLDPELWCARILIDPGLVDPGALAEVILSHPARAPSPAARATRGRNLRVENLASRSEPAIQGLLAVVRHHVDAYVARRAESSHPLMAHRPEAVTLNGWALVLERDGHERHHIHPAGWLTAVYYVRTPKGDGTGEPPPGALVFGAWPSSCDSLPPLFPGWHFEPQAGLLLIFPSFMGHHTIPTNVADARICVALDVMPCQISSESRP